MLKMNGKEEGNGPLFLEAEQIYRNQVHDIRFLREEELYEKANLQIFIPNKPITTLEDFGDYHSRKLLKREFVLQGFSSFNIKNFTY